jgi:hypothetical protein
MKLLALLVLCFSVACSQTLVRSNELSMAPEPYNGITAGFVGNDLTLVFTNGKIETFTTKVEDGVRYAVRGGELICQSSTPKLVEALGKKKGKTEMFLIAKQKVEFEGSGAMLIPVWLLR